MLAMFDLHGILDDEEEEEPQTVLLAEPDEALRDQAAAALREDGFEVIEVEDGLELRDYLEALRIPSRLAVPDIIVSETSLPGESALFVLAQLRQRDRVTP